MEKYDFSTPKQVVFADTDNIGEWLTGIAYNDVIICACCGGVFEIDEICELATAAGIQEPIYSYSEWIDISDDIDGGELPDGLIRDDATGAIIEAGEALFNED